MAKNLGLSFLSNLKLAATFDTKVLKIWNLFPYQRCAIHTSSTLCGKKKFLDQGIDMNKYSLKPLPRQKFGGRDPVTGKIVFGRIGGGHKINYKRVDFKMDSPKDPKNPVVERIVSMPHDSLRTGNIAIAATGNRKRYILAGESMKVGDLIISSGHIPEVAVRPDIGNAYAIGALPVGTLVHNIEMREGEGGKIARAAGTSGTIVNHIGDRTIVRMPSKREMNVSYNCMAVVGRVSNVDHNQQHIGSASRNRWLGVRPKSGLKQKKTGYHGRKINPPKKMKVYNSMGASAPSSEVFRESS